MKVGTKTVIAVVIAVSLGSSVSASYRYSVQVPKLEKQIQVLENTVSDQRMVNERLLSEKKQLEDKLAQTASEVQDLKQRQDIEVTPNTFAPKKLSYNPKKQQKINDFQITWYNDTGTTFSGKQTQEGVTVSVDPRVIPLGSWIRIEFEDGTTIVRRADDTGSKVKGKVVDVYKKSSDSVLMKLGRQSATVYILGNEV